MFCVTGFLNSFPDLKLHLQSTDYGNFLASVPSPLQVTFHSITLQFLNFEKHSGDLSYLPFEYLPFEYYFFSYSFISAMRGSPTFMLFLLLCSLVVLAYAFICSGVLNLILVSGLMCGSFSETYPGQLSRPFFDLPRSPDVALIFDHSCCLSLCCSLCL